MLLTCTWCGNLFTTKKEDITLCGECREQQQRNRQAALIEQIYEDFGLHEELDYN
jgi:hypothetical protein